MNKKTNFGETQYSVNNINSYQMAKALYEDV